MYIEISQLQAAKSIQDSQRSEECLATRKRMSLFQVYDQFRASNDFPYPVRREKEENKNNSPSQGPVVEVHIVWKFCKEIRQYSVIFNLKIQSR